MQSNLPDPTPKPKAFTRLFRTKEAQALITQARRRNLSIFMKQDDAAPLSSEEPTDFVYAEAHDARRQDALVFKARKVHANTWAVTMSREYFFVPSAKPKQEDGQ